MASNEEWRDAVLALADRHYRWGHDAEHRAVYLSEYPDDGDERREWIQAVVHEQIYHGLCGLVTRVDPRPGAGVARPW